MQQQTCSRLARTNLCGNTLLLLLLTTLVCHGQQTSVYQHPAADPAHHLTGKEFLKDIGGSFAGLISTHSIVPVLAGGAAYGIATGPEQDLERHFSRPDMWGIWGNPGKYIGNSLILAGTSTTLFAFSRKSEDRRFRAFSYALIHGTIVTQAIVQSTKAATHRLRPNGENHAAFPSGHASDSFMFATVAAEHYGWKAAIPGYIIAAYVSATRLEERKHHLTDVTMGAAVGYLVGKTVSRRMRTGTEPRFGFNIAPARRGFTCSVNVALR